MNLERAVRWIPALAIGYAVMWAVVWGYRLTIGGGVQTAGEALWMAISGIGAVIGLLLAWQVRSDLRSREG